LHFRLVPPVEDPHPNADALWIGGQIDNWIDEQFRRCVEAFRVVQSTDGQGNLAFKHASRRRSSFPRGSVIVSCHAESLTQDQKDLFNDRDGLKKPDVLVVVAAAIEGGLDGCAAHPPGQPGVILFAYDQAPEWLLAHELGHILDLDDDDPATSHNLMWGTPNQILIPRDRTAPELVPKQIAKILAKSLEMNSP
jgi:hypothetical protein